MSDAEKLKQNKNIMIKILKLDEVLRSLLHSHSYTAPRLISSFSATPQPPQHHLRSWEGEGPQRAEATTILLQKSRQFQKSQPLVHLQKR